MKLPVTLQSNLNEFNVPYVTDGRSAIVRQYGGVAQYKSALKRALDVAIKTEFKAKWRYKEYLKILKDKAKLTTVKPSASAWKSYDKYTLQNDDLTVYYNSQTKVELKNYIKQYRSQSDYLDDLTQDQYFANTAGEIKTNAVQLLDGFLKYHDVTQFISTFNGKKVWIALECVTNDGEQVDFCTKADVVLNADVAQTIVDDLNNKLTNYLEAYKSKLLRVRAIHIHVAKINPLAGSSYKPLPKWIQNKKAIINIKNDDDKCFLYSVLCGLDHHAGKDMNNAERVSKYKQRTNELIFNENDMPMQIDKLRSFEHKNNLKINVYCVDDEGIVPLYVSSLKDKTDLDFIHLFYHEEHYSYIKNFNRLFADGKMVCPYCCQYSISTKTGDYCQQSMEKHMAMCISGQRVTMPTAEKGGNIMRFKHFNNLNPSPIRIYADFETFNDKTAHHCSINGNTTFTTQHQPASYKILIVSDFLIDGFDKVAHYYKKEHLYCGADADINFIHTLSSYEQMLNDALKLQRDKYGNYKKMIITKENEDEHKQSKKCWICNTQYSKDNYKVRHHNHDTGLYHSTICSACNIQIKDTWQIPVMFHNLNYDKNVFFKSIVHMKDNIKKVSILADNTNQYKSFTINNFNFIDTMRFMNSSLAKLIENLPEDGMHFLKDLNKGDNAKLKYITQKGYFPYEWFDDINKLKLPISELKREHFDNALTISKLKDEEWIYIQELITENNITTFREFHDFYLHIDVNGLADVFENFRNTSIKYYKLEPCKYVGTPSFAWDALLLNFRVRLELLTDIEMYLMLEKGIRGGQSVVFKKHAKANNKYLDGFDESEPSKYITYLDANNLYAVPMSVKLPMKDFKWIDTIDMDTIMNYDDGDIGYILEVDLEYPKELHDLHNDYPLAPERLKIGKSEKLCGTFNDRKDYVVHIKNLKYYLEQGMILKKVSRVLSFYQTDWMKGWIDKNTNYRREAKNEFEKDYFKLMNNAVFGKTMENVRGRIDVKCAFDEKYFKKYTSKPNFNSADKIDMSKLNSSEDFFMLMKMNKTQVVLDKPIYAGFSILDISKLHMYKFHYGIMKPKYGESINLLMTDTDSFVYEINTDDLYKDMSEMKEHFDMSVYSGKLYIFTEPLFCGELYNKTNAKVIGKFKDETGDQIIKEFVGVRPKCYSFVTDDDVEHKKLKGISKCVVKKNIKFDSYKKCVFDELEAEDAYYNVNNIRTKDFSNYSLVQKKKAFSNTDDKRVWNGIHSYAYGHYKLEKDTKKVCQEGLNS